MGGTELFCEMKGKYFRCTTCREGGLFSAFARATAGEDGLLFNRFLLAAVSSAVFIVFMDVRLLLSLLCTAAGMVRAVFRRAAAEVAVSGTFADKHRRGACRMHGERNKRTVDNRQVKHRHADSYYVTERTLDSMCRGGMHNIFLTIATLI
jgi:hypothetical protein